MWITFIKLFRVSGDWFPRHIGGLENAVADHYHQESVPRHIGGLEITNVEVKILSWFPANLAD